jgi:hypothetical protein
MLSDFVGLSWLVTGDWKEGGMILEYVFIRIVSSAFKRHWTLSEW